MMVARTVAEAFAQQNTDAHVIPHAHDALNKMRRACKRGTGCKLSADEIFELSLTVFGEMWNQDDPRAAQLDGGQEGRE